MNSYQYLPLSITLSVYPPVHSVGVEMEKATQTESVWVFPPPKGSPEALGSGKQWLESITPCLPSLPLLTASKQCLSSESGHSHTFNSPSGADLLLSGKLCWRGLCTKVQRKIAPWIGARHLQSTCHPLPRSAEMSTCLLLSWEL